MKFPKPTRCAERTQRQQEQQDLESMVGEDLDALSDDDLAAVLRRHNEFAARLLAASGRRTVPRLTLLRCVFRDCQSPDKS